MTISKRMQAILAVALLGSGAIPAEVQAQRIESVVVPQKKTKDRITPTVQLEEARSSDGVAGADGALRCPGNGFVQHAGPPKRDLTVSGQPWLDKIDSETDGFSGEAMLKIEPRLRVHPPRGMRAATWIELRRGKGDDATLVGTGAGGVRVEFNRYSHDLVLRTALGRFVGSCRAPR